jgi:hypothetical protein
MNHPDVFVERGLNDPLYSHGFDLIPLHFSDGLNDIAHTSMVKVSSQESKRR